MDVEIGLGKKARQAYGFDDIAIVPSRRTRDPQDVDIGWKLGPHLLELPLIASAMDGVVSPEVAITLGELGGLGGLNLESIFTRYEQPERELEKIAKLPKEKATSGMQEIYARPVEPKLIAKRIERIKAKGVLAAGSLTPHGRGLTSWSSRERSSRPSTSPRTGMRSTSRSSSRRCRSRRSSAAAPRTRQRCTSCVRAPGPLWAASGPGRHARRAACWASAGRRRPRSPTRRRHASSTCSKLAST